MIRFEFLPAGSGDCIFINLDDTNGYFDRQYTYTVNNGLAKSVKQ